MKRRLGPNGEVMKTNDVMLGNITRGLPAVQDDPFAQFREDFPGYARKVLNFEPWSLQEEILKLCSTRPSPDSDWHGMLAVSTAVNTGKTATGGVLINAIFDCWGPSLFLLTTAPTQRSVEDLLWREVRVRRIGADPEWNIGAKDFIGPSAPEMKRSAQWIAKGFVATSVDAFKGRHEGNVVVIMDEATGIGQHIFQATRSLFKPDIFGYLWIALFNPNDASSVIYQEVMRPDSKWKVLELSALEHPNIIAELKGEKPPIPSAISLSQFEEGVKEDCDPILPSDTDPRDFEFPPGSNNWFRPGPYHESNFLGRWPSDDEADLWSDALWRMVTQPLSWNEIRVPAEDIPRIGCDVARKGFNRTAIVVALGDYAVHFEARQGQNTMATAGRLVELCGEWCERVLPARRVAKLSDLNPKMIPIKLDDDGVGGAVVDRLREQGYLVYPINAQAKPSRATKYPDKRSELWYDTRQRAREKHLFLGLLPKRVLDTLRRQAKAPRTEVMSTGQRCVERKEAMMARLEGESPDGMDALNLAFYTVDFRTAELIEVPAVPIHHRFRGLERDRDERVEPRPMLPGMHSARPRRRLFGQGT